MNRKGQMSIAPIILVFVAIIVGVILFQVIAQQKGTMTDTVAVVNESLGVASNSTTVYLTDYRSISDVVVVNSTNSIVIGSGNYTVTNNVVYNGALAVSVLPTTDPAEGFSGYEWNISGTAQPLTYIPDSGGRAMVNLIVIMFALAVVAVALYPVYQGGLKNLMSN